MLPDLIRRGRTPTVGITVHEATITLRITASGRTDEECLAAIRPTEETIRRALGVLVFGAEDDELEDVVVRLLAERQRTVSTVEWGTRGRLARCLARAAAAKTDCLAGSLSISSLSAADRVLTGSATPPPAAGAELAGWLARECRRVFASDFALSIGPFPAIDPDGVRARRLPRAMRWMDCRRGRVRVSFRPGHGREHGFAVDDDGPSSGDLGTPGRQAVLNLLRLHLRPE